MPPSIFERLNARIEADEARRRAAFDLASFSDEQRAVMRILLHDSARAGMGRAALQAHLGESPELREALAALCAEGWLIVLGESPEPRYKISPQGAPGFGIWSMLVDRLSE